MKFREIAEEHHVPTVVANRTRAGGGRKEPDGHAFVFIDYEYNDTMVRMVVGSPASARALAVQLAAVADEFDRRFGLTHE
jgi:hypothetical protein